MLDRLRRLVSGPAETIPELPTMSIRPIGVVRNTVKAPQPAGFDWSRVRSRILIRPELADGLLGLEGYSHVTVLFWPHLVPPEVIGSKHRLHPRDDPENPLQGILATRSQIRFNPILVTAVPLLSVKGNTVRVRGLDAIDGTPVLDIKPYFPHFDSIPDARVAEWATRGQEPAKFVRSAERPTRIKGGAAGFGCLFRATPPPRKGVSVLCVLSAGIRHPAPFIIS